MTKTITGYNLTPLDKSHNRNAFSCGIDALDTYLHKQAGQDGRKQIAVTYVLHDADEDKVAGYYTLSATAIELTALPENMQKKLPSYPSLPATLIGRLAIDTAYKKRGLGEILLLDAMKRAYRVSLEVASHAVVVDAINRDAEKFYKKYGFLDLSAKNKRLFLPMDIIKTLQ